MEPCPGPLLEEWVKDAGFVDVVHQKFPFPVGTWPADKHLVRYACHPGRILFKYHSFTHDLDHLPLSKS